MRDFYCGKRVLVTGHSGFKGGWLTLWLHLLGAEVAGLSLPPAEPDGFYNAVALSSCCRDFFIDIRDYDSLEKTITGFRPDLIFHLAAQALVRRSYREPVATYQTNVMGTLHLFEAARRCGSVRAIVNVTTDKCYENMESEESYAEDAPLGGYDMYSSSKSCVEIMSASYRRSFLSHGFGLATARAGNVIGGGDRGEDRLVPDCIRAIEAGEAVDIRNPQAVRPWQFVLEPLSGYLMLGKTLATDGKKFAQAFNFGPDETLNVGDLAKQVVKRYGMGELDFPPPDKDAPHEATLLCLDASKARKLLGWQPRYNIAEAVEQTVDWYKAQSVAEDMRSFSAAQIRNYTARQTN